MSSLTRLYHRLPASLQNAAVSAYGWREARRRYSPEFRRQLQRLQETQWWDAPYITDYVDERVEKTVRHAYNHVPYYKRLMDAHGVEPADVRSRADLHKIPVLTKEAVRTHSDALHATDVHSNERIHQHTSGTTGSSLHFSVTPASVAFQWAVWWRHRSRFGIKPGDLHANFTGKPVVGTGPSRPPYWRWNVPFRQAAIGMQQVVPEALPALVAFLNRTDFVFFSGYPSIVATLSTLGLEQGLELDNGPQAVFLGAENTSESQRKAIVSFTGAVVTDQYGFSEGAGNASQCEHGAYHEDFEFGVLDWDDDVVVHPDGSRTGGVIATGFANTAFPFLRYRVGDVATWEPETYRCPCGRASRVLRHIDGRIEDYVVTPEGSQVMRFDYLFKDTTTINEAQVVQRERGGIVVRAVVSPDYDRHVEEVRILSLVRSYISPSLRVDFEYVDQIERSSTGKLRAVRSYL